MKKLIGITLLLACFFMPCPLPAMETPHVAILALNATNSGTTTVTNASGSSIFVVNAASNQIRVKNGALNDDSKLKGWLKSDGFHSLYIMELTACDAQQNYGGDYSGVSCDIVVEYVPENTDEAWAKAKSITIFNDLALSGDTKQPVRFYPVWGSDFYRFKFTPNGCTAFGTAKIRHEWK